MAKNYKKKIAKKTKKFHKKERKNDRQRAEFKGKKPARSAF